MASVHIRKINDLKLQLRRAIDERDAEKEGRLEAEAKLSVYIKQEKEENVYMQSQETKEASEVEWLRKLVERLSIPPATLHLLLEEKKEIIKSAEKSGIPSYELEKIIKRNRI